MAAAKTYTFDIADADGGARRASIEDLGDADLLDDEDDPPITDGTEPYADQLNQRAMQIRGAGFMIDSAKLTIDWVASVPTLIYRKNPGTQLVDADFAIAVAGGGTGDFTITWTTSKLPPIGCDPTVTCNALSDAVGVATIAAGSPTPTQTRVRVQTRVGGTLTNVRCTVRID